MSKNFILSTSDNPYNPFTEWDMWLNYDIQMGYFTNEKLARVADAFGNYSNDESIEEAAKELIMLGTFDKNGNKVDYLKVFEK